MFNFQGNPGNKIQTNKNNALLVTIQRVTKCTRS